MTTWLFNPFTYIAGFKSFVIGWALMLLTAFIAYYSSAHFDGALDFHTGSGPVSIWYSIAEQLIDWGCLVLVFFLAGRFFSASAIRFIDVAGTVALARVPMLFLAVVPLFFRFKQIYEVDLSIIVQIKLIGIAFLILGFCIWMIILLYNAFKVSCNLKGNKAVVLFIASLLVAEVISKIIFYYLRLK